jgi:hypothetical protein
MAMAIFSPIINVTLSSLVDHAIYEGQSHSGNNGDQSAYYASLWSAKKLVVAIFNLTPFTVSVLLLSYMILAPLRKEDSDYYV